MGRDRQKAKRGEKRGKNGTSIDSSKNRERGLVKDTGREEVRKSLIKENEAREIAEPPREGDTRKAHWS